jgi:hypothetical protein
MKNIIVPILILATSLFCTGFAVADSFPYTGLLDDEGVLAEGIYDLQFTAYPTSQSQDPVAGPITVSSVVVHRGRFAVNLDFGAKTRWQESWYTRVSIKKAGDTKGYSEATVPQLPMGLTNGSYLSLSKNGSLAEFSNTVIPMQIYCMGNAGPPCSCTADAQSDCSLFLWLCQLIGGNPTGNANQGYCLVKTDVD